MRWCFADKRRRRALFLVALITITIVTWYLAASTNDTTLSSDLPIVDVVAPLKAPANEPTSWFANAHSTKSLGALTLTSAEQTIVSSRQSVVVTSSNCPDRFLFVNTHTYGRHHNQLQEMMNLAVWAKKLGRTAVLGWFRYNHAWTFATEYYNFSRIMQSYCLITPQQMMEKIAKNASLSARQKHTASCFGQKLEDTPLKRYVRGAFKCTMAPNVPAHYNTREGLRVTREFFERIKKVDEPLLVVSGQLGFFLRGGIAEFAAIFGLLEPSESIRATVQAVQAAKKLPPSTYFGIHLRQRENECMKEVVQSREDGGSSYLASMSTDDWRVVERQCQLTIEHIKDIMTSLDLIMDHQPMFLGSDHQNVKLEKALVAAGAVMYEEHDSGLKALAVDFFLLSGGRYFTGNQLSSVTQNICFRRLGRGQECNGFIPVYSRYHARNVETDGSYINLS